MVSIFHLPFDGRWSDARQGRTADLHRSALLVLSASVDLAFSQGGILRAAYRSELEKDFARYRGCSDRGHTGYSLLFTINLDPDSLPRIAVGAFLVLASILTLVWRAIYIRLYTSSGLMRRAVIVGAGKAGRSLVDIYGRLSPPPFILLGFVDDDVLKQGQSTNGFSIMGTSDMLLVLIEEYRI